MMALIAVADTHNYRMAADKLGLDRSRIYQTMLNLSEELNVRIIKSKPGTNRIELTHAAEHLAQNYRTILNCIELTHALIQNIYNKDEYTD